MLVVKTFLNHRIIKQPEQKSLDLNSIEITLISQIDIEKQKQKLRKYIESRN